MKGFAPSIMHVTPKRFELQPGYLLLPSDGAVGLQHCHPGLTGNLWCLLQPEPATFPVFAQTHGNGTRYGLKATHEDYSGLQSPRGKS